MTQTINEENINMEGCVMLAMSTFRKSQKAIDVAIEKCQGGKKLMVVYVIDINIARYLVGGEDEFLHGFRETCEEEMLKKSEQEGREYVATIANNAKEKGLQVKTLVQVGRFAVICLDVVKQIHPSQIVTTRSRRPEWVKKFFGAPVNELIAKAGCPVETV
jgi:nucleotide-binding universal stress UspA family protein